MAAVYGLNHKLVRVDWLPDRLIIFWTITHYRTDLLV